MNNSSKIIVKEASIDTVVTINTTIPEFDTSTTADYFKNRYKGKKHIIFVAYLDDTPIGYIVSYDKFSDGSIYCWMIGVNPNFRKRGALTNLMEKWKHGANKKTFTPSTSKLATAADKCSTT